ncbi:MAG: FadR/GntR family transcriptional regulator [Frankia sp.]
MENHRRSRVAPLRIAESVAATLRDRILASGDDYRLPTQDQLVNEFGVSYPSVREAIRILETEGLVTVRRGNVGGAEVHRPDAASAAYHLGLALQGERVTLGDLAAGLQMLEPLCAAECARRPDRHEEVVPVLRANIETSSGLVGAGAAFTHAARQFHELVVAFTPNATVRSVVVRELAHVVEAGVIRAAAQTSLDEYPSEGDAASVVRTHQRIRREMGAGRSAAAERVARAHLAATQAFVVERFDHGVVNAGLAKARPSAASPSRWRV